MLPRLMKLRHFSVLSQIRNKISTSPFENQLFERKVPLDFKYFRNNVEEVEETLRIRGVTGDIKRYTEIYDEFKSNEAQVIKLRRRRNQLSEQVKELTNTKENAQKNREKIKEISEEGRQVKQELATLEKSLEESTKTMYEIADSFPNKVHPTSPHGEPEIIKVVGEKPKFSFQPLDHLELGKKHGIIDFESAASVSGTSFYYLKGAAALLELALTQYALHFSVSKGFQPIITPDIVRTHIAAGCGYHPKGEASQIYSIVDNIGDSEDGKTIDSKCLVGTAEIPLAGMYQQSTLNYTDLPINMVAYGRAFRREVGHRGAENRGLYRVHQFTKVEMFSLCTPEESEKTLETFLQYQIELYQSLGLHFKVLNMPSHDLGASAYKKYDIEAWIPSRNDYGEISSASNCTDYQSRRFNIRFRSPMNSQSTNFVHTINATACAIPRVILILLEMGQQENHDILLPKVLHPYLHGLEYIKAKENK